MPISVSYIVKAGIRSIFSYNEVTPMDDSKIIEMYLARDEAAISHTKTKYGRLIYSVAYRILSNHPDSEECEEDTYMRTWESIPPTVPEHLSAYLTKIARNLALNLIRRKGRRIEISLIYDELGDAIPDTSGDITDEIALRECINSFLESITPQKRRIFIGRYFYMKSVREIARDSETTQGNIKVQLNRLRKELRDYLTERGIVI